jgi:hypothetical protein
MRVVILAMHDGKAVVQLESQVLGDTTPATRTQTEHEHEKEDA